MALALSSDREHADSDFDVWEHLLPYMRARGFSPDFLRISPALTPLPADIFMGTRPNDLKDSDAPEKFLAISCVYLWAVEPGNIQKLIDYLAYRVPLPADDANAHASNPISQSNVSQRSEPMVDSETVSLQMIFHRHQERKDRLAALLRKSPRSFLDILVAVGDDYDTKNTQFLDLLSCLEFVADEYSTAGTDEAEGPLPEAGSETDRLWRELIEGGLPRISLTIISCVHVLVSSRHLRNWTSKLIPVVYNSLHY